MRKGQAGKGREAADQISCLLQKQISIQIWKIRRKKEET